MNRTIWLAGYQKNKSTFPHPLLWLRTSLQNGMEKMNKKTIELLAVDGGGTKTRAVLVSADGTILGEGKAGASNYHVVGAEGAKKALVEAVLAAFMEAGIEPGHTVKLNKAVFALAGIDTVIDEKEVAGVVQRAVTALSIEIGRSLVENDCLSALIGATQNK